MRPIRQGSIPPPGGADVIVEQVQGVPPALQLHENVPDLLEVGEDAALEVQRERGVWKMA